MPARAQTLQLINNNNLFHSRDRHTCLLNMPATHGKGTLPGRVSMPRAGLAACARLHGAAAWLHL